MKKLNVKSTVALIAALTASLFVMASCDEIPTTTTDTTDTDGIETVIQDTPSAEETGAAPETAAPEVAAPEVAAPETAAPENASPEAAVPSPDQLSTPNASNTVHRPDPDLTPETVVDLPETQAEPEVEKIPTVTAEPETEAETEPPITHVTLRFHANGGNGAISDKRVKVNSVFVLPSGGFEREGHILCGFAYSPDALSAEYYLNSSMSIYEEDIDLYAVWKAEKATISFAPGEGTGVMDSQTLDKGNFLTLPQPTYTSPVNYEFAGWLSGGVTYPAGEKIMVIDDTTFTATWKRTTITVKITDESSGWVRDSSLYAGDNFTMPTMTETCEGHTFAGYTNGTDTYMPGDVITLTASMTLTVNWERNTYTVSFSAEGGSGSMNTITAKYGDSITLPDCGFSKSYNTFAGFTYGGKTYQPGDSFTVKSNATFTAAWNLKTSGTWNFNETVNMSYLGYLTVTNQLDLDALYEAGYTKYRVIFDFDSTKIKGSCTSFVQLFHSKPKDNNNVFWIEDGQVVAYKKDYRIIKEYFDVGDSEHLTFPWRDISELMPDGQFYIHFSASPTMIGDLLNNSYKVSGTIRIEFSR